MSEKKYMLKAISLAKKGTGYVNPNPLVGAVLVKDGKIIGQGYHHNYGNLHAERDAIKDCLKKGNSPKDATLYVTLEPCCHTGKQPPCTMAIIENGIKKVVVGSPDPNPLVQGKGISFLREKGIQVETDFLKEQCNALNPIFFHYITKKTPYILLKYAMTLDGKIATLSGDSKYISNEKSLKEVHKLRSQYSAILVGINTVLKDDPILNTRLVKGHSPVRIILDSKLSIPLNSKICTTADKFKTIIFYARDSQNKKTSLENLNITVKKVSLKDNTLDLTQIIQSLKEFNIDSIMVEGGAHILSSFVQQKLFNKIIVFTAPKITSQSGISPMESSQNFPMSKSIPLHLESIKLLDQDIMATYTPSYHKE